MVHVKVIYFLMLHALTQVGKPIALDTDSETEAAPEAAPAAVKRPPPAPPATLQEPQEPAGPAAAPSEADVWKAKYEELKLLLEQKQAAPTPASPPVGSPAVGSPPVASPAVASPPVAKPLFSPPPEPSAAEAAVSDGLSKDEEAKRLAAVDLSREELSPHALYMRLRRLCTPTGTGRLQVSPEVADQWSSGNRDELQLALVMALKQHGYDDTAAVRKLVRVGQGFPKKRLF